MAYGTNTSGNAGQVAIDRFAEMMIARMEQMKASDWKKGWIGGASGFAGLPQNVGGRNYSGSNSSSSSCRPQPRATACRCTSPSSRRTTSRPMY